MGGAINILIGLIALMGLGMIVTALRQIARSLNHIAVELTMLVVETGRKKHDAS